MTVMTLNAKYRSKAEWLNLVWSKSEHFEGFGPDADSLKHSMYAVACWEVWLMERRAYVLKVSEGPRIDATLRCAKFNTSADLSRQGAQNPHQGPFKYCNTLNVTARQRQVTFPKVESGLLCSKPQQYCPWERFFLSVIIRELKGQSAQIKENFFLTHLW